MTTGVERRIRQVPGDQASHRDRDNDQHPRPHLLHTVVGCTTGLVDLALALHRRDTKARITSHRSAMRWVYAAGVGAEARPPATNPSSATPRRSSRPAASPSAPVVHASRITRTQQSDPGLHTPLDLRRVRHHVTTGFRPPCSWNHKHSPPAPVELIELDLERRYDVNRLVDGLGDPPGTPHREGTAGRRTARTEIDRLLLAIPAAEYVRAIAGVSPNRAGKIPCPFHDDHTPSLQLYEDGTWYCYGACQAGGSIFDFAARAWRMDAKGPAFLRLRARLADQLGVRAKE